MYEELIKALRDCANDSCEHCAYLKQDENCFVKFCGILQDAADAIEELFGETERLKKVVMQLESDLGIYDELPIVNQVEVSKTEKTTKLHGRLIDADELKEQLEYVASLEWNQRVGASPGIECAIDMLDDAQTIIPASEKGE